MRVLVAGRNAKLLAANAGAFADDLTIETAATKAACFALLERTEFDLIIACETLSDGSGLEVLSHAAVNTPNSLRIFAARPSTLNLLKGELGLFGLFRTLPYPISFRKLWAAMNLARSCGAETEGIAPTPEKQRTAAGTPVQRAVVATAARNGTAVNGRGAIAPQAASQSLHVEVRQVVRARPGTTGQRASSTAVATVRNTASTQRTANAAVATMRTGAAANSSTVAHAAGSARQAQPRQSAQARATPTAQRTISNAAVVAVRTGAAANSNTAAHAAGSSRQAQPHQAAQVRATPTVQTTANAGVATGARRAAAAARQDARIPQTQAFKRALAKRNAAKLDANSSISSVDVLGAIQQSHESGGRGGRRREPAMSNDSLAQLARLTTTRRPTYYARGVSGGKKRAAIFVGSGVFAAVTAAVLTFFMLNANNSIGRSPLPLVASIDRPVSHKVFPWQSGPTPQQPASTLPVRSEVAASAAADLEVQAEAESDASAVEPGHPGPPPPNPPPAPYEPPSADAPGWVDE
jgi:hypothetical protein